jgi:predicted DNA-binding transcriptional regulator
MEMQISLKDTLKTARLSFDVRLAEVLIARLDLAHDEIEREFGISETVIRRVTKQFAIPPRKRGPKPGWLKKIQKAVH